MEVLDYENASAEVKRRLVRVSKLPFKSSIYMLLNRQKRVDTAHRSYAPDCVYGKKPRTGGGARTILYFDKKRNDEFVANREKKRFEILDLLYKIHEIKGAKTKLVEALVESGLSNKRVNAWYYLQLGCFGDEVKNEFIKKFVKENWGL